MGSPEILGKYICLASLRKSGKAYTLFKENK